MISTGFEHVFLGADAGFQRHHDSFTQRIDRRVGNLRKLLAEVIGHMAYALRQHSHWRVIAHRASRFLTFFAHRAQHLITLFVGNQLQLLMSIELIAGQRFSIINFLQQQLTFHTDGIFFQPFLVRELRLQCIVDVCGVKQLTFFGINREDFTRTDTAFSHDVFRLVAVNTDFRCNGNEVVFGDNPARWTQTVTVKATHGVTAIGNNQTSRAVPRLHMHGVVFIERTQIGIHSFDVLPSRRNHHTDGTEQVHTTGNQQFQHVIHGRRVRTCGVNNRSKITQVRQQITLVLTGTGISPAAVTLNGVDLTVVRQHAEWLSQLPARHGVGRETLMEYADSGFHTLVTEIQEEVRQIDRHGQTFIGQHAV